MLKINPVISYQRKQLAFNAASKEQTKCLIDENEKIIQNPKTSSVQLEIHRGKEIGLSEASKLGSFDAITKAIAENEKIIQNPKTPSALLAILRGKEIGLTKALNMLKK